MGTHQPIRKTVTPEIPDKLYFRIGDVARLCEVPAYVLRFWETEFPLLKPNKGGTGQRLYRKRDVEMALRIKSLLYDQGYTIPGARQVFKSEARVRDVSPAPVAPEGTSPAKLPQALAERPQTATGAVVSPDPVSTPEASLRESRLRALREEMQSLLTSLSGPIADRPPAGPAKLPSLRPRLVAEAPAGSAGPRLTISRTAPRAPFFPRPERDEQPALFPPPPAQFE